MLTDVVGADKDAEIKGEEGGQAGETRRDIVCR